MMKFAHINSILPKHCGICEQAMVSGAIGGFLDVAFNFNTQALLDDNLLGKYVNYVMITMLELCF